MKDRARAGWVAAGALWALGAGVALGGAASPSGPGGGSQVTFHGDVAPVLARRCAGCHYPDGPTPFSILTYPEARRLAKQMAVVTSTRVMPPWKNDCRPGQFQDERRLSQAEIALFSRWAEEGAPEGEAAGHVALAPPRPPSDWQLGTPDLVLEMPRPCAIPAEGPDMARTFAIPIPVPEDRWVTAVEFRPGNPRVVRHAHFEVMKLGETRRMAKESGANGFTHMMVHDTGWSGGLGSWVVGMTPRPYPQGAGRRLPRGSELALMIHYHPTGRPEEDRSTLALYFAKEPPRLEERTVLLATERLSIPAGHRAYQVRDSFTLPVSVQLTGVMPHAHALCREMFASARLPGGPSSGLHWLLRVRDWDAGWQEPYRFAAPLRLPKGTRLDLEFTYDNSADNPRNPNRPPRRVKYGHRLTDEMCAVWLEVLSDRPADLQRLTTALRRRSRAAGGHHH